MWYIRFVKGCDEDTAPCHPPREEPVCCDGSAENAGEATTSELWGRNAPPGVPVTVPMSGRAICNQGGTVEYFVSHP